MSNISRDILEIYELTNYLLRLSMKKIITISLISFFSFSCNAQTIVPRFGSGHIGEINYYYKDVTNFFSEFEGDWLYTNGNTSLRIRLARKENVLFTTTLGSYRKDILVGEFKYVDNGVETLNTLDNLLVNHSSDHDYSLYDVGRMRRTVYPVCSECGADEYRVRLVYNEPQYRNYKGLDSYIVIRKVIENGTEKLKLNFIPKNMEAYRIINGDIYNVEMINALYKVPFGDYTLIKQ